MKEDNVAITGACFHTCAVGRMPRHLSDADRLRNRAKRLLQLAARARDESRYDYATLLKRLAAEAFDHAKEIENNSEAFGLRKERLRALAHRLLFYVERTEQRFTLTRIADVLKPVRHEALTIEQAEDVLRTWKLRGFHGG